MRVNIEKKIRVGKGKHWGDRESLAVALVPLRQASKNILQQLACHLAQARNIDRPIFEISPKS